MRWSTDSATVSPLSVSARRSDSGSSGMMPSAAAASRRATRAVFFESAPIFAGEAGLPGACARFSDTLMVAIARISAFSSPARAFQSGASVSGSSTPRERTAATRTLSSHCRSTAIAVSRSSAAVPCGPCRNACAIPIAADRTATSGSPQARSAGPSARTSPIDSSARSANARVSGAASDSTTTSNRSTARDPITVSRATAPSLVMALADARSATSAAICLPDDVRMATAEVS